MNSAKALEDEARCYGLAFISNTSDNRSEVLQRTRQILEQVESIMALLESHAAYIHGYFKQVNLPDAHSEFHLNLATLLMRVVGARKMDQYTDSKPQV